MKQTLGIIGSTSMVGSRFCELSTSRFNLINADLHGEIKIDIANVDIIEHFFSTNFFDWVILFSAFTDVDEAEKQRGNKDGACWQINVEATKNVIHACQKYHRGLLFISTDFVFDGQDGPYSESNQPGGDLKKISWYGITKLEAESKVQTLTDFIILRISYPYRANFQNKDDFARAILKRYQMGDLFALFTDQKLTPTLIDDLPPAIQILFDTNTRGVVHLASPQATTPFEFAQNLISAFSLDPKDLKTARLASLLKKGATPRPLNGGLRVDKIRKLGFIPTNWQNGIQIIHSQSEGKLI